MKNWLNRIKQYHIIRLWHFDIVVGKCKTYWLQCWKDRGPMIGFKIFDIGIRPFYIALFYDKNLTNSN